MRFFKTTIFNSFSGNVYISISLGSVTQKWLYSFSDITLPWFFVFLEMLSSHLKKHSLTQGFTNWLWARPSPISPNRDSEAFSELFYKCATPHFLFLLKWQFLILFIFSWSCKTSPGAENPSFAFPRVVSWNGQVFVLSPNPTELSWISACAHWPCIKACNSCS